MNNYFNEKGHHFSLKEFTRSSTAVAHKISNTPGNDVIDNLANLCSHVLEPLRVAMGEPIKIGSGYRCPTLNKLVGGVSTSQHQYGMAADLCIDGDRAKGLRWFKWIEDNCEFDQLIMEHNKKGSYWVHVSYNPSHNRQEVIRNLLKKS